MIVNPYESPKSAAEKQLPAPRTQYRTKFWPVYIVSVPLTTLVAAFTVLVTKPALGIPFQLGVIVQMALVVCVFLTAFLTVFFRVFISETGLRCFDFWGRYHETPWDAMTQGKPINLFGLRYLRLIAPGHPTLWLPLFLHEQDAFWRDVGPLMPTQAIPTGRAASQSPEERP